MNLNTTYTYNDTDVLDHDDVDLMLLLLEEGIIKIDEDAYNAHIIVDPDFDDLNI